MVESTVSSRLAVTMFQVVAYELSHDKVSSSSSKVSNLDIVHGTSPKCVHPSSPIRVARKAESCCQHRVRFASMPCASFGLRAAKLVGSLQMKKATVRSATTLEILIDWLKSSMHASTTTYYIDDYRNLLAFVS